MLATPANLLDLGNPNNVPNAIQKGGVGAGLRLVPRTLKVALTSNEYVLPDDAKGVAILSCFATAGTTPGWKSPVKTGSSLSSGQCMINNTGDIELESTDACTAIECVYMMVESGGEVFEETLTVTTNLATLLQSRSAVVLLSAVAVTGGVTGAGIVKTRAAAVTNTTHFCALNLAGTGVIWNATDAVTSCTVRYLAYPGVGAGTLETFADRLETPVVGTPNV